MRALTAAPARVSLLGETLGVDWADDTLFVDAADDGSVGGRTACSTTRADGSVPLSDGTGGANDGGWSGLDSFVGCALLLDAGAAAMSGAAVSENCATKGAATEDVLVPELESFACCADFVD